MGWVTTGASWLSQFQKIALKLIPIVFEITVIGSFTDDHILNEKCKSSTRTGEVSWEEDNLQISNHHKKSKALRTEF